MKNTASRELEGSTHFIDLKTTSERQVLNLALEGTADLLFFQEDSEAIKYWMDYAVHKYSIFMQ